MVGVIGSINGGHLLGVGKIELYEAVEHYRDSAEIVVLTQLFLIKPD